MGEVKISKFQPGNPKRRDDLGDLCINKIIILKQILNK
jgi:hypothetical protein